MSFKRLLSQRFSLAIAVGLFFASLATLWWIVASPGITTIGENVSVGGQLTVSGNVGVGTTSPGQKIHIYGSSGSQRIKVESAGTTSNDQASIQLVAGGKSWIPWVAGDSDQLRFFSSTLNQNVMTLTSAGNVGIGTTSPGYKLDVAGTIRAMDVFGAGGRNLIIGDDTYLTDVDVANILGIYGMQNSDRAGIRLGSDGSLIFGDNGNVGIGTTAPGYKLDVAGALRLQPSSAPTGVNGVIYYDSNANKFKCYEDGSWKDCIGAGGGGFWAASGNHIYNTNTGNVGIGTTAPWAKLTIHATESGPGGWLKGLHFSRQEHSAITLTHPTNGGLLLGLHGTNQIIYFGRYNADGTWDKYTMAVNVQTGNVGIGTTSPQAKLDVDGSVRVTGAFYQTHLGSRTYSTYSLGIGAYWTVPAGRYYMWASGSGVHLQVRDSGGTWRTIGILPYGTTSAGTHGGVLISDGSNVQLYNASSYDRIIYRISVQ